jgi:hypothetical protein
MKTTPAPIGFGNCCACRNRPATGITILSVKAPVRGTGWGCLVCHLPRDGAIAVLCDECGAAEDVEIVDVVDGLAALGKRRLLVDFQEPFDHNKTIHERADRQAVARAN